MTKIKVNGDLRFLHFTVIIYLALRSKWRLEVEVKCQGQMCGA